ncbi:MAG: hypothetical protein QXP80_00920 [Zestosphaera sp.]
MFSIKYLDGVSFRKYVGSAIKPLSDVPLRVSEDGLLIRGLSPDKSVLTEVFIPHHAFEEYRVSGVNDLTVDRDEFSKVLKRLGTEDTITLTYEEGGGKVDAKLVNTKSGVERGYEVRVLSLEGPVDPIQLDLPVSIKVETAILQRLIRDVSLVGDELSVRYSGDVVRFSSFSEGREYLMTLERGKHLLELSSSTSETVDSTYDVDLVKSVAPALSAFDVAAIEFGPSLPFRIALSGEEGVNISFWIAPR